MSGGTRFNRNNHYMEWSAAVWYFSICSPFVLSSAPCSWGCRWCAISCRGRRGKLLSLRVIGVGCVTCFLFAKACRFSLQFCHWYGHLEALNSSRLIGDLCSFLQVVLVFRSRRGAGHGILKEKDSTAGSFCYSSFTLCYFNGWLNGDSVVLFVFCLSVSWKYYSDTNIRRVLWFYNLDVLLHPVVISSLALCFWNGGFFVGKNIYSHPTSYAWH
jgi:hypothetical protein